MKPDRPRGRTKATRAPSGRQNIHKKPAPIAKFSPDYTRCTALSPSPNMVIESLSITMVLDLFFHVILISKEKLERNWHRSRWGDGRASAISQVKPCFVVFVLSYEMSKSISFR